MPRKRFVVGLASAVALLCVLPYVYGLLTTPAGARYLGFQYNTDDQMVYAAWMRQAMNGRFLMDNRFAVDPQPGLTIHLYFWVLGLLAKVTGIAAAAAIARAIFGYAFVVLLGQLLDLVTKNGAAFKVGMILTCFGAGIGFLAWQPLSPDFAVTSESPLKSLLMGHLPNDVWQPEAFVFSSLLTNSLFAVSLCLILTIFICVLKARDSWRPVPVAALALLVLMNIHSYDVLLVAFVLVGLLIACAVQKQLTAAWLVRAIVIGLGAIPSALWFEYVLAHDPVFRARADTLTYTENFRSVAGGYILFMVLALIGAIAWIKVHKQDTRLLTGISLFTVTILGMFAASSSHLSGYWMGMGGWTFLFLIALASTALLSRQNPALNLIISWACIGVVAPYFPQLFERKLLMGLSIPWAILASLGLVYAAKKLQSNEKKLVAGLCTIVLSATSLRWFLREFQLIQANESNTSVQRVYLDQDERKIIDYLNQHIDDKRTVVLALPPLIRMKVDQLATPPIQDLNPILSGLTGVYTYAGHWSETPDADRRRAEQTRFFLKMSPAERKAFVQKTGTQYIVSPVPEKLNPLLDGANPPLKISDLRDMGQTVVDGTTLRLIKL